MKRSNNTPEFLLLFTDILLLNVIHLLLINPTGHIGNLSPFYTAFILFNNIAWLLSFYIGNNYGNNKPTRVKRLVKASLSAYTLQLMFNWIFVSSGWGFTNGRYIVIDMVLFGLSLAFSRAVMVVAIKTASRAGLLGKKVVILGCNKLSSQLIKQLEKKDIGFTITGFFDDSATEAIDGKYPLLGRVDDCVDYAMKHEIQEIYTVIPFEDDSRIQAIADAAELNFMRFKLVPDLSRHLKPNQQFECEQELPILSLSPEPLAANITGQIQKRFFDVLFSLFVIVFILSWLAPILALLIKLDSDGPVFFKQLRTGIKNKSFLCLKFRSLHVNNDADNIQVTQNDSRYTRLGRFLRKTNLDELPQFFNVLAGDMSIVGSRPHMLKHTEIYSRIHNKYMRRHYIKPGLTGWAQVNGYRGEIKVDEQLIKRVDHDLWYIDNWNFWLDMRIVFNTFSTTFKGDKNAY